MENLIKEINEYSFIVNIGERFGVAFYEPKVDRLLEDTKKTKETITNEFGEIINKITIGFTPENATYVDVGIPFIRVQDIDKNGIINIENSKRISFLDHENNLKSRITNNNILLVITGATVGKTALFKFKDKEANISQNIVKISLNQNEKVSPDYILYFLRSDVAQFQLIRNAQRIAQEYLNYPAIKSIFVTYPNDINDQEKIIDAVKKCENKSWSNLKAYSEIIKEINMFIITKLNIKLPIETTREQSFVYDFSNNLSDRIDCYSHSIYYQNVVKILRENQDIEIIKGKELNIVNDKLEKKEVDELKAQQFKYVELKHTTELGMVKGHKEDILFNLPTRARQIIQTNDILLPRPIGSTEQIAIVPEEYNNQLCSTGFIVIRPKDYNSALLMWGILKSELVQTQLFYLQSGSLQPEITPTNFKEKVLIPLPNKLIQQEIINDLKEKINQAKELLTDYEINRQNANQIFLEMLLNKKHIY